MPSGRTPRPESNLIKWTMIEQHHWFGSIENYRHIEFQMFDENALCSIRVFHDERPDVTNHYNLINIPFSDRYRNRALRFAQGRRVAEQFWAEIMLDVSNVHSAFRLTPATIQSTIDHIYEDFSARMQGGKFGISVSRKSTSLR